MKTNKNKAKTGYSRQEIIIKLSNICVREGNGNPLQYSCQDSMDRGAEQATVHGVTELDMTEQLTHNICVIRDPKIEEENQRIFEEITDKNFLKQIKNKKPNHSSKTPRETQTKINTTEQNNM